MGSLDFATRSGRGGAAPRVTACSWCAPAVLGLLTADLLLLVASGRTEVLGCNRKPLLSVARVCVGSAAGQGAAGWPYDQMTLLNVLQLRNSVALGGNGRLLSVDSWSKRWGEYLVDDDGHNGGFALL